jgi:hypothetical protein
MIRCNQERRLAMSILELTMGERRAFIMFLDLLEQYLLNLKIEIATTDEREFRRALKLAQEAIQVITGRLEKR